MEYRSCGHAVLQSELKRNDELMVEPGTRAPLTPRSAWLSIRSLDHHRLLAGSP
jgi:hypothetical protein